jgi:hypothetical protein
VPGHAVMSEQGVQEGTELCSQVSGSETCKYQCTLSKQAVYHGNVSIPGEKPIINISFLLFCLPEDYG